MLRYNGAGLKCVGRVKNHSGVLTRAECGRSLRMKEVTYSSWERPNTRAFTSFLNFGCINIRALVEIIIDLNSCSQNDGANSNRNSSEFEMLFHSVFDVKSNSLRFEQIWARFDRNLRRKSGDWTWRVNLRCAKSTTHIDALCKSTQTLPQTAQTDLKFNGLQF